METLKSTMFGQETIQEGSEGPLRTCKRCYLTRATVYQKEWCTESLIEPRGYNLIAVCSNCSSKIFIVGLRM